MTAVNEVEAAVQRVPVWGWGALGAGVLVIYMAKRHAAAAALVDPNAAVPNVGGAQYTAPTSPDFSTSPGSTPDSMSNPFTSALPLIGSSSAAGSATYAPATYTEKLTDLLGGTLGMFANGLTNAPNEIDVTMPGGVSLSTRNNVATFGGGNGTALQSPDQTNANTQSFAARALAQLQSYTAQTNAQHVSYEDQVNAQHVSYLDRIGAMQSTYVQQVAAQQGWLDRLLGVGAPATAASGDSGGSGIVQRATGAAQAIAACASGNFSCIKSSCPPGDATCAKSVAPWWNGAPIGGWSAGY